MKTHKNIRIELAASQDKTRQAISEPYLDIKDGCGHLVATDGKIMAIIPVATGLDESGFVSADVLKAARKQAARDGTVFADLNGSASLPGGIVMPRVGNAGTCQFPNWRQVLPSNRADAETLAPVFTVGIDAKRLWLLAQAMGCQGVQLTFTAPDKPIEVAPAFCGKYSDAVAPVCMEAKGVIMPVILPAPVAATEPASQKTASTAAA